MYSNVPRENEYINCLKDFIHEKYNIRTITIIPAKRGYYGETWRINTHDTGYFVKLVYPSGHIAVYKRSFSIIQHLCDHGIEFISRIVKAKDGGLYTEFDGAVLGIFNWIDGENIETDATIIPEYQMLARVYTVPAHGVSIPHEDFSGNSAEIFFNKWNVLDNEQLLPLLEKNRSKLEHRAARLKYFAGLCQNDTSKFFITHGDAGGNLIVNGDKHFIVDWDNPVLAPPERDAWCMCSCKWARDAFHNALRQNGIEHTLRSERLAYYCYDFFFFYLAAYLDGFTQFDTVQTIEEYIDRWIEKSIEYADKPEK
ncbi:MAG: aminoglycoside phosphotransferase family protein [Treponema sp.]|nr:aminoglycoside phosphotransferase family protein [Treponema sp.]